MCHSLAIAPPKGLQPVTNVPAFNDMYICEVCNQTYHWVCLKNYLLNTGCYTERQREEVEQNDNWACPGSAHLNDEQKQKRYSDPINTKLKIPDWKSWTYTDRSCHIQGGKTVIGAGVYHPSSGKSNLVEPNGAGITNTIGRAELAAIAAAITQNHIHIATDSLASLHQIRKQLLYPEKHRHHVQGDILIILSYAIQNSQSHILRYKAKSHAGIAGNERADALAKYQACHGYSLTAETTIRTAGPGGNPFFDISWLSVE